MEVVIRDDTGKVIGTLPVISKTFSTGSVGYYGAGKVYIGGAKYQVSINIVKVGSKEAK